MTNVMVEATADPLASELEAVLLWRREQFGQLGFDQVDSQLLADSSADLGQARRLRRAGCPIDLAFSILA